ncbi:MAG: YkuS family protein [Deltaproteobacteria bacterium]
MITVVALDDGLTPVKDYLTEQGCQIINIDAARERQVDAVVLSGIQKNYLGFEGIQIDAPVFSAKGMTPEQVWNEIQRVSNRRH